jgi:hypothetical protein
MALNSILAIETNSTAFAYKILNEISKNDWIEIVEISAAANAKNFLLFQTHDFKSLQILAERIEEKYSRASKKFIDSLDPQIIDLCLIENLDSKILPALISLEHHAIEESLIVLECQSICGILSALQLSLTNFALKICDLKLMRQTGGISQAFLTGATAQCRLAGPHLKQKFLAEYRPSQVECIEDLTPKLREFFSF